MYSAPLPQPRSVGSCRFHLRAPGMNKVGKKLPAHHQHSLSDDLKTLLEANGIDVSVAMFRADVRPILLAVLGRDVLVKVEEEKFEFRKLEEFLQQCHRARPQWHIPVKLRSAQDHLIVRPDLGSMPSHPSGRKKALLVGVNYIGQNIALAGCINDARNEKALLQGAFGFKEENIVMLTEDQDDESKLPTCARIREGLHWLIDDALPGDSLFFAYSGHGSQVKDLSGEEEDGLNECICPLDCMTAWPRNVILDDELNDIFYDSLPSGVSCVCVFDCCHSGSMGDLHHSRNADGISAQKEGDSASRSVTGDDEYDVHEPLLVPAADVATRSIAPPETRDLDPGDATETNGTATKPRRATGNSTARQTNTQVWCLSGCQDAQTSADATINGVRQGAFTWSILTALKAKRYDITYDDLLVHSAQNLRSRGFKQIPSISSTTSGNFRQSYLGAPDARALSMGEPQLRGFTSSWFSWLPCSCRRW